MNPSINAQFDSGNINVVKIEDSGTIRLSVRKDNASDFLQWFYFNASNLGGRRWTFVVENASLTTYPKGWESYDVVCSDNRQQWVRHPTVYDGQVLKWDVNTDADRLWFAYFAPYSMEKHADLISAAATAPAVNHQVLGMTHHGRPIDYLKVLAPPDSCVATNGGSEADTSGRPQLWVIARQHPGESMASWFMEGWLDRLLDLDDATSYALRTVADIHVVPHMNPDGSYLGNLRTNSLGVNLNREWAEPSTERSPEVFHVLNKMRSTGVTLALDVHGDEALPYNFIAGTEGIEGWTSARNDELVNLKHTWSSINPDFQDKVGYPINPPGKANLAICSNQLAAQFNCLALTLEMPFKDTANNPRPATGWSPERCMRLGASFIDVAYLALTKRLLKRGREELL